MAQFTRRNAMRNATYGLSLAIALIGLGGITPATIAEDANFGTLSLNPKTRTTTVDGSTGGTTSLAAVTTNLDQDENQCFGYGDPQPDHILELDQSAREISLIVNSRGQDTTLIIQAPDESFRCGDDLNGKDAGIEGKDWKPGKYRIWVGTVHSGKRHSYKLTVQTRQ
jgi:hypothetical protein